RPQGADAADEDTGEAPQDEDAHEEPARSPAQHAHRAGDFKNPVAPEEDPTTEAHDLGREPKSSLGGRPSHAKTSHRNVDTIEVRQNIEKEEIRDQINNDTSARPLPQVGRRRTPEKTHQ